MHRRDFLAKAIPLRPPAGPLILLETRRCPLESANPIRALAAIRHVGAPHSGGLEPDGRSIAPARGQTVGGPPCSAPVIIGMPSPHNLSAIRM